MRSRDRVLAVLDHEPVDRLPVDLWHTDEVLQALGAHFGEQDELALYRRMGVDKIAWVFPLYAPPDQDSPSGSTHLRGAPRSMWGTPLEPIQAGEAHYHEFGRPPLLDYETPRSLDDYPFWPDPDLFAYDEMASEARRAHEDFVVLGPWVSLFEIYCQMRGLETAFVDLLTVPEYVVAALDRIEACQTEMMTRFLRRAGDWIDMVFVSDDMGSQHGPLIAPSLWERFFRDRVRRWCDLIHGFGKRVFYHSDGAFSELIPGLITCGIDVLNPIQHVCPGMDRAELKQRYGDRLVFHGGVENQKVLPFGTVEDVRKETRTCMRTLGGDGTGYIVCSCHNIQPGTPLENILAMIETVHEDGVV